MVLLVFTILKNPHISGPTWFKSVLFKGQLTWQGDGADAMRASVCLVTQSCLTLCNPLDCSPPGSSVAGKNTGVSYHFPSGDLPDPGIKTSSPVSPALQADS